MKNFTNGFKVWDKEKKSYVEGEFIVINCLGHTYSTNKEKGIDKKLDMLIPIQKIGVSDKDGNDAAFGDYILSDEGFLYVISAPDIILGVILVDPLTYPPQNVDDLEDIVDIIKNGKIIGSKFECSGILEKLK